MLLDEDGMQTLTRLGLSILEAKMYLALCRYGTLNTKELSKLTKTAQTDTYRVLTKLQRKGLVEKIIRNPAKFKAVPIEISIQFLLDKKKGEYDDLKEKTKLLICSLKERPVEKPEAEPSQFSLIPQSEAVVKKIKEAIENSKKSVDIFLSWRRFSMGATSAFAESSQKAWDRGVKFRIVIESPRETADVELAQEFCGRSPFCSIRFFPSSPKTVLGIYDKKHFFVIVDPEKGLFDSPALWSNNRSLISVVQDYFDMLWHTAIKEPKL